ncbi:MAG: hypothetical protein CO093_09460 [Alphaproteobacteria bacterium CG_4_9_14_3_um_filter_47_13]|nr:MAG: hypothetical protein CO093_09460 [Alphaproteobacteria bacterium CG_4_9_14_3_um_filter_47_13]
MPKLLTKTLGFSESPTLLGNQRVTERRARGETVYHMGFGESPFPVPPRLQKALAAQVQQKKYLNTAGLAALRQSILQYYAPRYGIDPADYDVIISPGSKLLIFAVQMAYEGDLVMVVPSWVSYVPQAQLLGQKAIKVPAVLDDNGYHLDAGLLRKAIHDARVQGLNPSKIILNTPNNPAGLCIPEAELVEIAKVCAAEDIVIIADDIYAQVCFKGAHYSIAQYAPAHTVISSAVSKHLSLGGWRLGFGLVPKAMEGLFESLCQIASETWSAVASPIQYAALEAFAGHEDIENHIRDCTVIHEFMNNYMAQRLKCMGVICPVPQGAFYVYPDFAPFKEGCARLGIHTSDNLFMYLFENYNIASLPGICFGEAPERLTLRLSGCDYDGGEVLNAYRAGRALQEEFITEYAPHIKAGCDSLDRFIGTIRT